MIGPDDFRAVRNPAPAPPPSLAKDPDSAFFRNLSLGAVAIVLSLIVIAVVTAPHLPPSVASLPADKLPPLSSNEPTDSMPPASPRTSR